MRFKRVLKQEVVTKVHEFGMWKGYVAIVPKDEMELADFHEELWLTKSDVRMNWPGGKTPLDIRMELWKEQVEGMGYSTDLDVVYFYEDTTDFRVVPFLHAPMDMTITHVYDAEFLFQGKTVSSVTLKEPKPLAEFKVVPAAAGYALVDEWDAVKITYTVESVFMYSQETYDRGDEEDGDDRE